MGTSHTFRIKGEKPAGLTIHRDEQGTPHIHSDEFAGCMWGVGYCHGIDRTTQLLMMRILGKGRLCELLDDSPESLEIDTFFRRANWHNNLDQQVALLDEATRALCQTYCDGVNAGLTAKKIYALKLLGYKAEPWTIGDIILLSRMAGYLTLSQSQAEVERFFVELVQADVDLDKLAELFPFNKETLDVSNIKSIILGERIVASDVLWNKTMPRMMASNNWVVAGKKTKSGAAIMANDPHLEVNRLPNVWYEQAITWGNTGLEAGGYMLGMGMPGLPGVIVGRNKDVAWGATYTFMDTVDSWIEDCKEGSFRRGQSWQKFTPRQEIIKRKNNPDSNVTFYENMHGVLDGNPNTAGKYLATKWSLEQSGAQSLMASMKMGHVKECSQAMEHLGAVESAWSWVMADTKDNIAFQMSGLMPKRVAHWNGFTPAPGWDETYDWQGMVDFHELPKSLNPKEGYIVTANNDLNHLAQVSPINMPMGDYRAKRIEQVLSEHDQHSIESTKIQHLDVYSGQAKLFLEVLLPLLKKNNIESTMLTTLTQWDLKYEVDSKGAVLFEQFYEALRLQVFGNAGLGEDVVKHLTEQTGIFIDFYRNFDQAMLNEKSSWYQEQSREQAFISAFKKLVPSGNTSWGEKNSVVFTNMLFQGKLPSFLGFDSKPIPLRGGRATPHQGQIYQSAGRQTSFAPSIRLIAQMDQGHLYTSLAGGPSDNRFSRWYTSGLQQWIDGKYKSLQP